MSILSLIVPLLLALVVVVRGAPSPERKQRAFWGMTDEPTFCARLKADPQLSFGAKGCQRNIETGKCSDGSTRFISQFNQDYYLYTNHFVHLKRQGVYVDLAANHPYDISNTYFFDRCLGWDGLCIEANPMYHDLLRVYRSCSLVPQCISDVEGEQVEFFLSGPVSGIINTNKRARHWRENLDGKVTDKMSSTNMTCTKLGTVLKKKEVTVIDYLSLDIEGHEFKALQSIDWDSVKINVMTIEMNENNKKIGDFLESKGYKRYNVSESEFNTMTDDSYLRHMNKMTGSLFTDIIFLHNSVTFGKPE